MDEISNVSMEIRVSSASTIPNKEGGPASDEDVGLAKCNTQSNSLVCLEGHPLIDESIRVDEGLRWL